MNGNFDTAEKFEIYVRSLRDAIYGPNPKFCTDEGWHAVKRNWMKPENVAWLEAQKQNQVKAL